MSKVVLYIENGIVQGFFSDIDNLEVVLYDLDWEFYDIDKKHKAAIEKRMAMEIGLMKDIPIHDVVSEYEN